MPVEEFYASAFVLLELVAREVKTQIAGVTVVNDVSGFGFKHIRSGLEGLQDKIKMGISVPGLLAWIRSDVLQLS